MGGGMIIYYIKTSTTDGKEYLLGYDTNNPSTGDVKILEREMGKLGWREVVEW